MANQVQVYDLFVTCVDKIGPLLKIWGQVDRQTSVMIEQLLLDMLQIFEQQNFIVPIASLQPGILCCAKYKDGIYYRAQIRNLKTPMPGTVEVRFVDYGNIELIQVENIRLFEDSNLKLIKPQASEFILAGVVHSANVWDDLSIAFVHHEITYTELKTILICSSPHYKLVKVMLNDNTDLAAYLANKGLVTPISPQGQEIILRNISALPMMNQQLQNKPAPNVFRSPPKNPELFTYKPELLQACSEHMVYVSYVEDGPYLFSIQLQAMEETLEQLMQQINGSVLEPFTAPPLPGNPCLARCVEDNTICRAVVLNLVGDKCKTYYVDFGNTDILPFVNIYQIPYNHLLPKVMSMRFTLAGLKNINITNQMKCAFKDYVTNKLLKLKVVKLDDSPLIQYCELFDENNRNILEVLYEISGEFKGLTMSKGAKHDVIVSYIEGCKKFFVQLKECSVSLNNLMLALASTSENAPSLTLQEIKTNQACCAFYSGDNQWYRAKILSLQNDMAIVKYVDYGNEETVAQNLLKKLDPQFVNILPAQAIECCLLGYQNMSFNTEIENAFESLTLECNFTMKVMGKLNSVLLVDLFDAEGNNVAALLIERLAAQKSQTLPAQQVANSLLNNTEPQQIKNVSPTKDSWRSQENKPSWKNSGDEEKKNWRSSEENKSWRNSANSPSEKPNRFQSVKHTNESNNRKGNQKKKREKGQYNDDPGAKGDSWDSKPQFKKREYNQDRPKSRGEKSDGSFGDDKKPYQRNEYQRKPREERQPHENWPSERKPRENRNEDRTPRGNWNEEREPHENWPSERKPRENRNEDRTPRGNWNEERKPRNFEDRKPRNNFDDRKPRNDRPQKEWGEDRGKFNKKGDASENSSEKSWKNKPSRDNKNDNWDNDEKSQKGGKSFSPKKDYSSPKKELPTVSQPLAELSEPFKPLEIIIGSNDTVAISWFYNPQNFFCQILSRQQEFKDMMVEIQTAYASSKSSITGEIPIGSSVIAEFAEDSILYRATVLEKMGNKYKVQYIDFGNVGLIGSNKIWQVQTRFLELPVQSIRCGISSIKPIEENWPASQDVDNIFNKESFLCVFENIIEDVLKSYEVQLWDNDINIKEKLVEIGVAKDGAIFEMDGQPIDINLLLGQYIKITISSIESLQKFYAQLDKTKMTEINNAIISFNIDVLKPLSSETIIPEISCLVKINEEKWCRGVIIDNTNSEAISLYCPDYGNKVEASPANLYPLPPELCIYWYQAFECTLHNLTNDACLLVSDEKFKEDFENKEVIAFIDTIGDGKLILTLYDTEGKKLDLFDPDEGAFPTVDKLCPLPVFNTLLTVYVTHIDNADSVYLQQASDSTTIAELLQKLYEFYENGGETAPYEKFSLCCALSSDGNWYRAKMTDTKEEEITVTFIDYGNSESVPKENVKVLDNSFYDQHELALHVGLNLTETSPEFKDKLSELTLEKELKANIYFGDNGWLAELYEGDNVINKMLVDLNLATIQTSLVLPTPEKQENPETRAAVSVTHVDSPTEFYVQLNANENDITMLQLDLQEKANLLQSLETAEIGSLCAAKYTVDEQWYRAEVLDADNDITTVRFVDFGNTDVIDNKASSLKTLPSELLAIDKYAKKCSLNIKSAKGDDWSQEACEVFENAINVESLLADIVYQDEKTKTFVELFDGEKNIAQLLIDQGFAERVTRDLEDDIASNSGFVSHFNSISEFWIQLESSIPDLEMIVERLTAVDTFPDLQDLSPGMLCAANYPEDEMWYRARILSNTVAGVEVLFIDYGNSSTALKLKVLPEELIHMPALAQKCSLNKPTSISEWPETANEKFSEISSEGATVFCVKKLAPGETAIVDLFVGEENIINQLILSENVDRPSPIGEPNYVKCFINNFVSPDQIYLIKTSDSDKLDETMAQICQAETFEALAEKSEGKLAVAIFEDVWYRAKILPKDQVLLYDYGLVVESPDLRTLPEGLFDIPSHSMVCRIEKPNNILEDDLCKIAFREIHDESNEYDVEFINNETVRIFLFGVNIIDYLVQQDTILENKNLNVDNSEISKENIDIQCTEKENVNVEIQGTKNENVDIEIQDTENENVDIEIEDTKVENVDIEIQDTKKIENVDIEIQGVENENVDIEIQGVENENVNIEIQGNEKESVDIKIEDSKKSETCTVTEISEKLNKVELDKEIEKQTDTDTIHKTENTEVNVEITSNNALHNTKCTQEDEKSVCGLQDNELNLKENNENFCNLLRSEPNCLYRSSSDSCLYNNSDEKIEKISSCICRYNNRFVTKKSDPVVPNKDSVKYSSNPNFQENLDLLSQLKVSKSQNDITQIDTDIQSDIENLISLVDRNFNFMLHILTNVDSEETVPALQSADETSEFQSNISEVSTKNLTVCQSTPESEKTVPQIVLFKDDMENDEDSQLDDGVSEFQKVLSEDGTESLTICQKTAEILEILPETEAGDETSEFQNVMPDDDTDNLTVCQKAPKIEKTIPESELGDETSEFQNVMSEDDPENLTVCQRAPEIEKIIPESELGDEISEFHNAMSEDVTENLTVGQKVPEIEDSVPDSKLSDETSEFQNLISEIDTENLTVCQRALEKEKSIPESKLGDETSEFHNVMSEDDTENQTVCQRSLEIEKIIPESKLGDETSEFQNVMSEDDTENLTVCQKAPEIEKTIPESELGDETSEFQNLMSQDETDNLTVCQKAPLIEEAVSNRELGDKTSELQNVMSEDNIKNITVCQKAPEIEKTTSKSELSDETSEFQNVISEDENESLTVCQKAPEIEKTIPESKLSDETSEFQNAMSEEDTENLTVCQKAPEIEKTIPESELGDESSEFQNVMSEDDTENLTVCQKTPEIEKIIPELGYETSEFQKLMSEDDTENLTVCQKAPEIEKTIPESELGDETSEFQNVMSEDDTENLTVCQETPENKEIISDSESGDETSEFQNAISDNEAEITVYEDLEVSKDIETIAVHETPKIKKIPRSTISLDDFKITVYDSENIIIDQKTPRREEIEHGSITRCDLTTFDDITSVDDLKTTTVHQTALKIEKIPRSTISLDDFKISVYDSENIIIRQKTPRTEKIVPGSISRGDLTTFEDIISADDAKTITVHQEIPKMDTKGGDTPIEGKDTKTVYCVTPKSTSRRDITTIVNVTPNANSNVDIIFRVTPRSEKIVPGSISRGDISSFENETMTTSENSFSLEDRQLKDDTMVDEDINTTSTSGEVIDEEN